MKMACKEWNSFIKLGTRHAIGYTLQSVDCLNCHAFNYSMTLATKTKHKLAPPFSHISNCTQRMNWACARSTSNCSEITEIDDSPSDYITITKIHKPNDFQMQSNWLFKNKTHTVIGLYHTIASRKVNVKHVCRNEIFLPLIYTLHSQQNLSRLSIYWNCCVFLLFGALHTFCR